MIKRIKDGSMTFVFGSNFAGIHGKGAALVAAQRFGAIGGVGQGIMGNSYAIPTKDKSLAVLPLSSIKESVNEFISFASTSDRLFYLTRVGCGLAGYKDIEIAPLFANAPRNVVLPGLWRTVLSPGSEVLAVIGSRGVQNFELFSSTLNAYLSANNLNASNTILCSGGAGGADSLAEEFVRLNPAFKLQVFEANWDAYGKAAGPFRNITMAGFSSRVIAFWDGKSPGTKQMFEHSRREGLKVEVISCPGNFLAATNQIRKIPPQGILF